MDNISDIIVAIIAGLALLKTSTLEYKQKKQRAHWFFDEYMLAVGKCIVDYEKNKEEYFSYYMRYLLYADNDIQMKMKDIDLAIKKNDDKKVITEVEKIKNMYNEKYNMNQYYIKENKKYKCKCFWRLIKRRFRKERN